jgi:hypothetical protein
MEAHEIARFPPILQLVALALLGGYVAVSVAGRVSRRLQWFWDDADEAKTVVHFVEYTLVPALMLAAAGTAVVLNWNARAPLDGGWTIGELSVGPLSLLLGAALMLLAKSAGRRIDTSDAASARAWIPLLLLLTGVGVLAFGAVALGRTVKSHRARGGRQ